MNISEEEMNKIKKIKKIISTKNKREKSKITKKKKKALRKGDQKDNDKDITQEYKEVKFILDLHFGKYNRLKIFSNISS